MQIFRVRGIGDIDDRRAVRLGLAGQRIDRIGNVIGAAVMADIGDPAVALMMNGGLIGAARLQVVTPHQFHVGRFRRRPDHLARYDLALGMGAGAGRDQKYRESREKYRESICQFETTGHVFSTQVFKTNLRWSAQS